MEPATGPRRAQFGEHMLGQAPGGTAHERIPLAGFEKGLFGGADGGAGVGAEHQPSATTMAVAMSPSWLRERCQRLTPRDLATSATVSEAFTWGAPAASMSI